MTTQENGGDSRTRETGPEHAAAPGQGAAPDHTAERVALWRALHVLADPPPHVLTDTVGLRIADPPEGWRKRGDMNLRGTSGARAGVVARARYVEDLVEQEAGRGTGQYVILGAGLDTFAQRRPDLAAGPRGERGERGERGLRVFEVDQPGPQEWKRQRLTALGYGVPEWLRLVPVDFEAGWSWREHLTQAGFDPAQPAVVACTGVSMYLTAEAIAALLREVAALAPGSVLAMTFMLPEELLDEEDRPLLQMSVAGARRSGTPFISFFAPQDMLALARDCGFREVAHVSAAALRERYFAGRADGLRNSTGEDFLVATT